MLRQKSHRKTSLTGWTARAGSYCARRGMLAVQPGLEGERDEETRVYGSGRLGVGCGGRAPGPAGHPTCRKGGAHPYRSTHTLTLRLSPGSRVRRHSQSVGVAQVLISCSPLQRCVVQLHSSSGYHQASLGCSACVSAAQPRATPPPATPPPVPPVPPIRPLPPAQNLVMLLPKIQLRNQ